MASQTLKLSQLTAHAKAYGFIYPSSEIYEGLQAVYDYGPYGAMLKRNLQDFWWKSMTQTNQQIVGLDAAILMNPRVWEASGHTVGFNDWMIDHLDSKKRYRVDLLIEAHAEKLCDQGHKPQADKLLEEMAYFLDQQDGKALQQLVTQAGIKCPIAQNSQWAIAKKFNLMFATNLSNTAQNDTQAYLRPETAQGIFVNFTNVQKTTRKKIPFGIAQIGKAFRNEIVARQFIFRMREFEQMEMQYFIPEEKTNHWFDYWTNARLKWYEALDIDTQHLQVHTHQQLAHYAKAAVDITYQFPFGYKEVEGIHARGDFDLKNHEKLAGKSQAYFEASSQTSYLPHVIETSAGCDRLILMLLSEGLKQVKTAKGTLRTYLKLPPPLAPIHAAILPLMKKDGLAEYAEKLFQGLKYDFSLAYETSNSIGKRYAHQDLLGTPYCFTVDYQTLQDDTITVRERDTMQQTRLPKNQIQTFLKSRVDLSTLLKKLR